MCSSDSNTHQWQHTQHLDRGNQMPLIPRHRLRSDNNPCLSPRVPDPGPGAVHFQRFTPQSHAIFVKPSHTALTLVAIDTNSDGHVGAAVPAPYSDEQVLIYKGYQSRGRIIVMIMVKSERIQIQSFRRAGTGAGQVLLPARLSPDNDILQVSAYIGVVPLSGPRTQK